MAWVLRMAEGGGFPVSKDIDSCVIDCVGSPVTVKVVGPVVTDDIGALVNKGVVSVVMGNIGSSIVTSAVVLSAS